MIEKPVFNPIVIFPEKAAAIDPSQKELTNYPRDCALLRAFESMRLPSSVQSFFMRYNHAYSRCGYHVAYYLLQEPSLKDGYSAAYVWLRFYLPGEKPSNQLHYFRNPFIILTHALTDSDKIELVKSNPEDWGQIIRKFRAVIISIDPCSPPKLNCTGSFAENTPLSHIIENSQKSALEAIARGEVNAPAAVHEKEISSEPALDYLDILVESLDRISNILANGSTTVR